MDKSFDLQVRFKKRLFMTATERIVRGPSNNVDSMDDVAVYGDRFHQLSFKKAIESGIVSDYRILTIAVTDSQIKNLIEENKFLSDPSDSGDIKEAKLLATGIALKRAYKKHKIKHAISFHNSSKKYF